MGVYDVNGEGLNDLVTAMEGHKFGLGWYEQKRDGAGTFSFVEPIIMDNFLTKNAGGVTFTETHATAFPHIDGDGIPDLFTGKRAMSHLFTYSDPDPFSGAGSHFAVGTSASAARLSFSITGGASNTERTYSYVQPDFPQILPRCGDCSCYPARMGR